jgi:DNA-binding MarR family transcriptional regulator/GNAT superfamily N-acetyltransferase
MPSAAVAAVRRFNRFYTRHIGVLHEHWDQSPFSLTEMRVLFELAHREHPTAVELRAELGLDAGYLSRIVARFQRLGYVRRLPSPRDARESLLALTARGRAAFAPYDAKQNEEVAAMLAALPSGAPRKLTSAMQTIHTILQNPRAGKHVVFRQPAVGDLSWITHRQSMLYANEYGWNAGFETLAMEIVAHFMRDFDSKRERCWIAELDGQVVGSVFCAKKTASVAKLRMLYVESWARGLGIGRRLVDECVAFARKAGYKKMTLWTQRNLTAARAIYAAAGFKLTERKRERNFGHNLVAEVWDLDLRR